MNELDCGSEKSPCDVNTCVSYRGLEEISKITMQEAALSELLMPKINEIIERVDLLIRLKEIK